MPSTTAYRQGDIVLVPFTPLCCSKRPPVPIVSPGYLQRREDLVLVTIASRITDDPNAVHLWRGDFAEGRLP